MEVYEGLEKALDVIKEERNWCQNVVTEERDHGFAYCAVGALGIACGGPNYCRAANALVAAARRRGFKTHIDLNNETDHATTVSMFQGAIRAEKQKAGISLDLPSPQPDEKTEDRTEVAV